MIAGHIAPSSGRSRAIQLLVKRRVLFSGNTQSGAFTEGLKDFLNRVLPTAAHQMVYCNILPTISESRVVVACSPIPLALFPLLVRVVLFCDFQSEHLNPLETADTNAPFLFARVCAGCRCEKNPPFCGAPGVFC